MKESWFREKILPLKDKLFRLALRITLDRAEAEDVVQDTLLKMWERREEWAEIKSLEAFCMTICRNQALDRSKAAQNSNLRLNEEMDSPPDFCTPAEQLDSKMRLEALHQLIDNLPETQRCILLLRDNEGKPYNEIAEILGLSESQVKVYLHRARQRLKEQFARIEQHGL